MLLLVLLPAVRLEAQVNGIDNSGRISGRVVDAGSLRPLDGVVVVLERAAAPAADRRAPPLRSAVTDSSGTYRFERLPAGEYRVHVERIGYLANSIEVALVPGDAAQVAVGLVVEPILLPAIEVAGSPPQPYVRTVDSEAEIAGARVDVARLRQEHHLVADARELTHGEVVEAVTLGETDLFRALQRVPGVTTRDDYTATMWTRGASWDQTRVYFDGLPLFNPTHTGWLFSAVNPDGIGGASFHPGHRSAEWGEGTAAVLNLRSRVGGERGDFRGGGELSPASVRAALDGRALGGRVRWMVAARRTYVDLLSRIAKGLTGGDLTIPYDFSDVIARTDLDLGRGWSLEASGITERDFVRGDIPGLLRGNEGRWGNRAGRLTVRAPLGGLEARVTGGRTHFGTAMLVTETEESAEGPTLPALENSILHDVARVELRPAAGDAEWAVGYEWVNGAIRYEGPFSLLGALTTGVPRDSIETFSYAKRLQYSALWGERRWGVGDWLVLTTGMRAEFGDSVHNGGVLRFAPRLAARWQLDRATSVSAGWARSFQYTQDVAPAAGPIGPQLHLSALWVLADRTQFSPVARADVETVGVERWIGREWLLGANAYRRSANGLRIPNPDTGAVTPGRDPDAVASNRAYGYELSLRRLAGFWTGSLGYAFGDSQMRSVPRSAGPDGRAVVFPSSADVRHALDLTAMARVSGSVRAGGAFTFASGVPFTRLVLPGSVSRGDDLSRHASLGAPNAERTPSYASLDLMLEYTTSLGSWDVSAYAQLRNALNRRNAVTYSGSVDCRSLEMRAAAWPRPLECGVADRAIEDRFDPGLPRLPLFGVRVAF